MRVVMHKMLLSSNTRAEIENLCGANLRCRAQQVMLKVFLPCVRRKDATNVT